MGKSEEDKKIYGLAYADDMVLLTEVKGGHEEYIL